MSRVLDFDSAAAAEFQCVVGDYEAKSLGLGVRFRCEVESACTAILEHPRLWRLRPGGYRRVNLPGFPYYVAFIIEAGEINVVAVAHASRHPGYFSNRLP